MSKKVYITENQFNNLFEGAKRTSKKSKKEQEMDYVKANRKERRKESRERYGDGFKSTTRVSKSEKNYSRKGKNKFNGGFLDDED